MLEQNRQYATKPHKHEILRFRQIMIVAYNLCVSDMRETRTVVTIAITKEDANDTTEFNATCQTRSKTPLENTEAQLIVRNFNFCIL